MAQINTLPQPFSLIEKIDRLESKIKEQNNGNKGE